MNKNLMQYIEMFRELKKMRIEEDALMEKMNAAWELLDHTDKEWLTTHDPSEEPPTRSST